MCVVRVRERASSFNGWNSEPSLLKLQEISGFTTSVLDVGLRCLSQHVAVARASFRALSGGGFYRLLLQLGDYPRELPGKQ